MSLRNVAFCWTPHYQTLAFRVAKANQRGEKLNYIIVCCSKQYNGVYVWDAKDRHDWDPWNNNGKACYCVPIQECRFLGGLDTITNPEVIKEVKYQQERWLKYDTKKRKREHKEKPEWFI